MFNIELEIKGQKMSMYKRPVVSGFAKYLCVSASFSKDWEGLTKVITFLHEDDRVERTFIDDKIGDEQDLRLDKPGVWLVGVTGFNSDGRRITTNVEKLPVDEPIPNGGEEPTPEDLSLYEQALAIATETRTIAAESKTAAEDAYSYAEGVADALKNASFLTKPEADDTYQPKGDYLTEHQDISGKQNTIPDLAAIREGAALGKTALQSETDPTVPDWAKQQNKPVYTAAEVGALPAGTAYQTPLTADVDYLTPSKAAQTYQPKGTYLTEHQSLEGYAKRTDIPNLDGYAKKTDIPTVPTKVGELQNDKGYLTEHQDISGKQDTISDLETIRDGASKGATAVQPSDIEKQAIVYPSGTNDTAAIQTALDTCGHVRLVAGEYVVSSTITLPDYAQLIGSGQSTKIKTAQTIVMIDCGVGCAVRNVELVGTHPTRPSAKGTGVGIRISGEGKRSGKISGCTIHGFNLAGIYLDSTGASTKDSVSIDNCDVFGCFFGLYIRNSEYTRTTGCTFYDCSQGCKNQGGNNVFINCGFNSNATGYNIDPAADETNQAHGSCVGCTFNHNSSYAFILNNIVHGYAFVGCQYWYGKLFTYKSKGIIFSGCEFGNNLEYAFQTAANPVIISGCEFAHDPGTIANAKMNGCYTFDGALLPTQ